MLNRELINAELRLYALKLERKEARKAASERAFINAHAKQALRLFEELREQNWGFTPERGVLCRMLREQVRREQVRRERMH